MAYQKRSASNPHCNLEEGGRPQSVYVGVDIGASKILVGVSRSPPTIDKKTIRPFPKHGDEFTVSRIVKETIVSLLEGNREIKGIGVGTIGPLDFKRGVVTGSPNAPIRTFVLKEPLESAFKTRVIVHNDCTAAVWSEAVFGRGRSYSDIGYITISSGVGGGFVLGGRLVTGRRGNAHEVGHIVVDYKSNIKCGCGGTGHWEAIGGGFRIREALKYLVEHEYKGPRTEFAKLCMRGEADYNKLFDYYSRGDFAASALLEIVMKAHAAGIASVIATYDPEVLFLGGSIFLNHKRIFLQALRRYLRSYAVSSSIMTRTCTFGFDSVLVGAIALVYSPPPTC